MFFLCSSLFHILSFGLFFGPSLLASSTFDQSAMKGSSRALFGSVPGYLFTPMTQPKANQQMPFATGSLSSHALSSWFGLGFGMAPAVNLSQGESEQSSQPEKVA
jgi:hypothetical protein